MTLIETLVVVAITVLLAVIAFPSLDRMAGSLAAAEARVRFTSDLRLARADAIRTGRPSGLRVEPDGSGYQTRRGAVSLPDGTRVQAGRDIVFAPDGSAAAGVIGFATRTRTTLIRVDPVMGTLSLSEAR